MRIIDFPGESLPVGESTIVTIGKFQGIHRGHRALLAQLVEQAHGLTSTVVTFDRHPLATLAPDHCPAPIIGDRRRFELFEQAGVEVACILRFDRQMAATSPRDFVRTVLVEALHAKRVIVGEHFRFGSRNAGTVADLKELGREFGFAVEALPLESATAGVAVGEDEKISTSAIRADIERGDVAAAAAQLGRPHEVEGLVVHGLQRGRAIGFPTANLGSGLDAQGNEVELAGLIPADGVYAGYLLHAEGGRLHAEPAAISVGTNPTFADVPRTVEAFLLHGTYDLYDQFVRVQFVARLRGMAAFDGVPALVEQMRSDVVEAEAVLHGRRAQLLL